MAVPGSGPDKFVPESPWGLVDLHQRAMAVPGSGPDKFVPESPWGLVDLHQRVIAVPGSGPVLAHCSAGIGRTDTFIGLCNLLHEAEVTGKMDFKSALWKLRQDRMHTIQTVASQGLLNGTRFLFKTLGRRVIQAKLMTEPPPTDDLLDAVSSLVSAPRKNSILHIFVCLVTFVLEVILEFWKKEEIARSKIWAIRRVR
ncbi:hypothetical protein RRG08_046402 [Elysia crispata]|uniref:Tyrosine specific protein phosphatases domain-containing protein n=1 Tax=Elysia crispata TaxID=231223 RepID=A0AAE1A8V6_9GAST|nr:hypothetical protein RRG08_046402 [Elysia crispata]